jgi:site-specific recombinase XerD
MKNGGWSLNLDYMIDGIRTRESLKLYLVPEKNRIDKARNQETMKMALAIQARRTLEIQSARTGVRYGQRKDMLLTDYIEQQAQEYKDRGHVSYSQTLVKIGRWVKEYGHKTTLLTVDKNWVLGFVGYLADEGLAPGTVFMYFSNLNTIFNNAYRAELMNENPIRRIETSKKPHNPQAVREYLTLAELRKLSKTRCPNNSLKKAFLFACFTGLRLSDIENLSWDKIRDNGDGLQVELRMVKNSRLVYVPLTANAIAQLPKKKRKGKVFDLPSRFQISDDMRVWIDRSKIGKKITFHCSRHTYATILLTYGADIYTVSALMGHAHVKTTQVYAKVIDEKKRKAVDMIPAL